MILGGAGMVITTVGITKVMLNSAVRAIKEHCQFQREACDEKFCDAKKDICDLYSGLNSHGHKALDQNGSKVTR